MNEKNYIRTELNRFEKYLNTISYNINPSNIVFAISLKSKRLSRNWDVVKEQLTKTLRSILNNTESNYHIIIAGHEKPDIIELEHSKITWISANFPISRSSTGMSHDKMKKRKVIANYLSDKGYSGFFMPLDADDWVHYRFVEFINKSSFSKAYIFNQGIMSNLKNNEIWSLNNFYKHCGSCSVFYFEHKELLINKENNSGIFHTLALTSHPKVIQYLKLQKIRYQVVNYPMIFRTFGYGDNNLTIKKKISIDVSAAKYKTIGVEIGDWIYQYFRSK